MRLYEGEYTMSEEIRDKNGLTEAEYLKNYNPDKYKKPALTADICIITDEPESPRILLIKRGNHPHLGRWALPGGFSEAGERIEETAARELLEETSVQMSADSLKLVGVYSKPGRDPRGWTVSCAYLAIVDPGSIKPIAADDAADAKWFTIAKSGDSYTLSADGITLKLSDLAFDHEDIVSDALKS